MKHGEAPTFFTTYFFHFRNIAKIGKCLSKNYAEMLIHAFVTSRLDNCNALPSGYPDKPLNETSVSVKHGCQNPD
jgi:hypothetical protein